VARYTTAHPDGDSNQKSITRVHQAYGRNYPVAQPYRLQRNLRQHRHVLWNWRMFLVTGEARFMDVAELTLYNSVLSGAGTEGTNFFYVNPLRVVIRCLSLWLAPRPRPFREFLLLPA